MVLPEIVGVQSLPGWTVASWGRFLEGQPLHLFFKALHKLRILQYTLYRENISHVTIFSVYRKCYATYSWNRGTKTIVMLITWPHDSASASVSEPSPPPSSPPPSRSCRSSRPPTGRTSSAGSRQRAFSTRRKQQESIQGGDAGRRLQRRLLPPSCCSKFPFVCFVFLLSTCHSSPGELEARPAACSNTDWKPSAHNAWSHFVRRQRICFA